jgi:hypothetical protein
LKSFSLRAAVLIIAAASRTQRRVPEFNNSEIRDQGFEMEAALISVI